eukprot:534296-Prorocentrum_minimum.AAC.1
MFLTGGASSTLTIVIAAAVVTVVVVVVLSLYLWGRRRPCHADARKPADSVNGQKTGSVMLMPLRALEHLTDIEAGDPFSKRLAMLRGIMRQ